MCSKFSFLINFHSLNRYKSVLLDHIALTLDREGIKARGGGGPPYETDGEARRLA